MSDKKHLTTLGIAGAAFVATLAASNVATAQQAGANPFAMNELPSGYMQVAEEGKCGDSMKKDDKGMEEGKCGDSMKKDKKGMKDGKCGEGKCGDSMKKDKKGMKEGKCGGN